MIEPVQSVPVLVWIRRLVPLAIVATAAVVAIVALGKTSHSGGLTGTWSGYIAGKPGGAVKRYHMRIVVNARETGGSWRISGSCHGSLTLENISNGFHHYHRLLASGAHCGRGYIDCLERHGAGLYDAVTSRAGGEYDSYGTLSRVST
jgi:hypothetical protein